jgi:hypothetical protein
VIGRRLPAEGTTYTMPEQPGDYSGPVMGHHHVDPALDRPSVFFLMPTADDEGAPPGARSVHRVASPPHVFRECPDGSLEIRESIAAYGHNDQTKGPIWHGYLDEGHVWRTV